MKGYSNLHMCMCVCVGGYYYLILETIYKIFTIQKSFQWMEWDVKGQNYKIL